MDYLYLFTLILREANYLDMIIKCMALDVCVCVFKFCNFIRIFIKRKLCWERTKYNQQTKYSLGSALYINVS